MWFNRVRYQNMICYSVLIEALHSRYTTDGILQHVLHKKKTHKKNVQAPFRRGTRPRLTFWSSLWQGEGVRLGRIVSSHAVTWLWRTRQRTQGWCYKSAFVLSGAGSRMPFLVGWGWERVMWCRYAADPPAPPSSWAMACMWHHWPADCSARLCLELSALVGSEREKGCNKLSCSDG